MMNRFEVIAPADVGSASRLMAENGHVALAGGVDVLDLAKQNISTPDVLVNLKGLKELSGIEVRSSGELRLGATAKLSEVAENPEIRAKFAAIAPAVIDPEATNSKIALLVGSAIAWKTSLRKFIA